LIIFPHLPLETSSVICSGNTVGFPPLDDIGNWHTATNLFELQGEIHSWYRLFAPGAPLKWKSHILWRKLLKPVYCDLKSKFPLDLR
jgi:hypothetical protein